MRHSLKLYTCLRGARVFLFLFLIYPDGPCAIFQPFSSKNKLIAVRPDSPCRTNDVVESLFVFVYVRVKRQMDYAIGWNRFNLTVLGVWPEPSKTTRLWRLTSASIFWTSTTVTILFICAPQTADLILNSTSLDEAIENLSINIPIAFAVIKQIVLRYNGKGDYDLLCI